MSIEGEKFVLGTILLDDRKFPEVAAALDEGDFSTNRHQRIFQGMRRLNERGEGIEILTLGNELKKLKLLDRTGGYAYLAGLTEGMPRLSSIQSYVKIVKDRSVLRKLIHTAQGIVARCFEAEHEVDDILAESESAVMKVGNELLRSGLESPGETIKGFEGGLRSFLDPSRRERGLSTPFHAFNEMTTGLRGGQLIILAARPAMGKTAMALNIATHVAMHRAGEPGRTVAFFSLEMSREALLTRVICTEAMVDQVSFRKAMLDKSAKKRLEDAAQALVASKLFIDDTGNLTLMEVAAKCRRLKSSAGLSLVVVDYLQLMASKGRVENRVQEIAMFSRGLKLLAKDLDVPVLALSQLSRKPESARRKDHRPILSDLRDSGSIEQDADVVCFIFREEVYNRDDKTKRGLAELIVGKQRNGPIGRIRLRFARRFTMFQNLAEGDEIEPPREAEPEADEAELVPF